MDPFFYMVIIAGAIAGASTSLLGVYIVGMRMPFIGTCISHAAMAGTIFAIAAGINGTVGAIVFSMATSLSLTMLRPEKLRVDTNVGLAILFSLMLGLTFLGMGLVEGSRAEVLGLLWGSILFVRETTVFVIAAMTCMLMVFCVLFNKELKTILFSRAMAAATGVHETVVYGLFLALCGLILSVNLKIIGGLMIFSLMINPAAAAYQICRGHKAVVLTATLLGMFTAIAGFLFSFYFDLPTGACIVVVSAVVFALAAGYRTFLGGAD